MRAGIALLVGALGCGGGTEPVRAPAPSVEAQPSAEPPREPPTVWRVAADKTLREITEVETFLEETAAGVSARLPTADAAHGRAELETLVDKFDMLVARLGISRQEAGRVRLKRDRWWADIADVVPVTPAHEADKAQAAKEIGEVEERIVRVERRVEELMTAIKKTVTVLDARIDELDRREEDLEKVRTIKKK